MITGKVTINLAAVIEVEVVGSAQREKIEAVIDTGFYGSRVLPSDLTSRLTRQQVGNQPAFLGDANEVDFESYLTKLLEHGDEREATTLESDAGPLGGMALVYGSRVILNLVESSDGRIDARPGRAEMEHRPYNEVG